MPGKRSTFGKICETCRGITPMYTKDFKLKLRPRLRHWPIRSSKFCQQDWETSVQGPRRNQGNISKHLDVASRLKCRDYLKPIHLCGLKLAVKEWGSCLSRHELCILAGLLTGHVTLNSHLTVMKIQEDRICSSCSEGEDVTALHFLGSCAATAILRRNLFRAYVMEAQNRCKMCWSSLVRFARASERFR